MNATQAFELALAIVSLILAVILLIQSRWTSLIAWAMLTCDLVWILRLVPALHGT